MQNQWDWMEKMSDEDEWIYFQSWNWETILNIGFRQHYQDPRSWGRSHKCTGEGAVASKSKLHLEFCHSNRPNRTTDCDCCHQRWIPSLHVPTTAIGYQIETLSLPFSTHEMQSTEKFSWSYISNDQNSIASHLAFKPKAFVPRDEPNVENWYETIVEIVRHMRRNKKNWNRKIQALGTWFQIFCTEYFDLNHFSPSWFPAAGWSAKIGKLADLFSDVRYIS